MKGEGMSLKVSEPAQGYSAPGGEIILYNATDGSVNLEVRFGQDTFWLNQKQMAELFQRERPVITKHLRNVFETGKLDRESNMQKMHIATWFLQKNAPPYRSNGTKLIADNALVAMTLLIAKSRSEEKDLLTRVLAHLIHPERS
jgi:hypothetical protein